MSDTRNCIFHNIIGGEIPGRVIDQDADVIVFLALENHPLVVTKTHVDDIFSLRAEPGAAVMRSSIRMAKALREALQPDGIFVCQLNGAAAGQEVFHYHPHPDPRWKDGRVPATDDASPDQTLTLSKRRSLRSDNLFAPISG